MSKLTEYTFEIYKKDNRIKKDERYGRNKKGLRFVEVKDFAPVTRAYIETLADDFRKEGLVVYVYETFVTRKNMMSNKEYQERYDTPYFCSPSSETFWSA
jgi:predicted small secreted protein